MESLEDLKTLKGLNLRNVKLSDEAVTKLVKLLNLPDNQLEVLDLSNTSISLFGIKLIASALSSNTTLTGLDLSDNALGTDWVMLSIIKIITSAKSLKILGLNNCGLQPRHGPLIMSGLSQSQLKQENIELDDNNLQLNNSIMVSGAACMMKVYPYKKISNNKAPQSQLDSKFTSANSL